MYNPNIYPNNRSANAREMAYAEQKCRANPQLCNDLKRLVPRGSTVYYLVVSVAPSGMSRNIRFFVVVDGKIVEISSMIRDYLGYSRPRSRELDYAVRFGGTGSDMGHDAVVHLSSALYGESYSLNPMRL